MHLRWNSLTDFAGPVRRSYTEISKQLRIPLTTVRITILAFVSRGYDFAQLVRTYQNFRGYTPRL